MEIQKGNTIRQMITLLLDSGEPTLIDVMIDPNEILPMVPPGCGLTEIVGEYKVERENPGEIPYRPSAKETGGD